MFVQFFVVVQDNRGGLILHSPFEALLQCFKVSLSCFETSLFRLEELLLFQFEASLFFQGLVPRSFDTASWGLITALRSFITVL